MRTFAATLLLLVVFCPAVGAQDNTELKAFLKLAKEGDAAGAQAHAAKALRAHPDDVGMKAAASLAKHMARRIQLVRQALEGKKGTVTYLTTRKRRKRGTIAKITDQGVELVNQIKINGKVRGETRVKVAWKDLAAAEYAKHLGDPLAGGTDEIVAHAIALLAENKTGEARAALKGAAAHPLTPFLLEEIGKSAPPPTTKTAKPAAKRPKFTAKPRRGNGLEKLQPFYAKLGRKSVLGRRTVIKLDFRNPAHQNLRYKSRGKFIKWDDGTTVLEARLTYGKDDYSALEVALDLPRGVFYTISPYTYLEYEIYYEGDKDPEAFVDIRGRLPQRKLVCRSQLFTGKLEPGVWNKVSRPICHPQIQTYMNHDREKPAPGDVLNELDFYADIGQQRGIRKFLIRNIHIFQEDRMAVDGTKEDAKDKYGFTQLHYAVLGRDLDKVKALIEAGADVHAGSVFGETPMHMAARADVPSIAELLVDAGAKVNAVDKNLRITPLHQCALRDRPGMAKWILDNGGDPAPRLKDGRTPFYWACKAGSLEFVKVLVAHKRSLVDVRVPLTGGKKPLDLANQYRRKKLAEYLKAVEAKQNRERPKPKPEDDVF